MNKHCFVRIYKDFMVSKRTIVDLSQSINKNLTQLKQKPFIIPSQKQKCNTCGEFREPALPHQCRPTHKCIECGQIYDNGIDLSLHLQQNNHHYCGLCRQKFKETLSFHKANLCGCKRLSCMHCGSKIPMRYFSDHISTCCFRKCQTCNQSIFFQVYYYHVHQCIRNPNARQNTRNKKHLPDNTQVKQNHRLPCSVSLMA